MTEVDVFEKVILAVDGSEESRKAAAQVEALADRFHGEIVVLHVRESAYPGAAAWTPEWTPDLETYLADIVSKLQRKDIQARSDIRDARVGMQVE